MAELSRNNGTVTLERSGTRLVEHAPPAPIDVRDYPNERAALTIFRKRLVELLNAGWLITRDDDDIRPVASWPAMEARLRERFEPDLLAVYTDFLIDRDDPCGDATAQRKTAATYETFGCFAELADCVRSIPNKLVPQWDAGWLVGVTVHNLRSARPLALLLAAPIARFLSKLEVVGGDYRELPLALGTSPYRGRIRELVALEPYLGTILLPALPSLERATIAGARQGHATLRELVLHVPRNGELIEAAFPSLEHLVLHIGNVNESRFLELLDGAPLERLHSLRRVDIDGELSARGLDRVRDRLSAFAG